MSVISIIIGLAASVLLLTSGYLYGARRGFQARELLRRQNLEQAQNLTQLRESLSQQTNDQEKSLQNTIQQVLAPLVQREQLSLGLSRLDAGSGQHRDLTPLLDQIARVGNFSTVLLSDEEGLPVAANSSARELDRWLATSSLLLVVADRITASQVAAPQSIVVHDEANSTTLCRFFRVQDQRLSLTAVASGARLTPTALDPAVDKLNALLGAPSSRPVG